MPTKSPWPVLKQKALEGGVFREVQISPAGIVLVQDQLPGGRYRTTRVRHDGRYGQGFGDTPRQAWLASRKACG